MNNWKTERLGDLCELYQPQTISSSELVADGEYLVFGANGIIGRYDKYNHEAPQLLITCRGATCGAVNISKPYSWINGNAMVVKPKDNIIDLCFLKHIFLGGLDLSIAITGAAQPQITRQSLSPITISFPPLAEQQRIAAILDKADELRAKRRTAIAELDSLTQAIFCEMFGDPGTIFKNWPIQKIGDSLDFLTSGSRGWAEHYAESGDLFIRIQNVGHDEMLLDDIAFVVAPDTGEAKRTRVEPGDVLLSITADLGRTAVVPLGLGKAYINQHLAIIRSKSFDSRFLSAFLTSPMGQFQIHARNKQGVKAGLNFEDIRSFNIPNPPIVKQKFFTQHVSAIDSIRKDLRDSQFHLDSLFSSLQQRAFSGEL